MNIELDPHVLFIYLVIGIITEALADEPSALRRLFRSVEFIACSGLAAWAVPNVPPLLTNLTGITHGAAVFLVTVVCLKGTRLATIRATPRIEAWAARFYGRALLQLDARNEKPTKRNVIREMYVQVRSR